MNPSEALLKKISDQSAVIGIIGVGYVGLPLSLAFSEAGFQVTGFDVDESKVARLNAGESIISHIPHQRIESANRNGFRVTGDFAESRNCDALVICVPTPLGPHREPDLSFIASTMDSIAPHLRAGQVLCLESTTYPGTTEEEIVSRVEQQNYTVGEEVFVVYSPEREDPANPDYSTQTIPKICGGHTPACLEIGKALYGAVIGEVVPVSSTRVAEMAKLLENIHRSVNIGLANEMKMVADRMGIDIHEVIEAAKTKPFGFTAYYPGPGLGGHCIPIDPFYLTWKAHEVGVHTRFIELAGEINASMPRWVVRKLTDALNQRQKAVNGSRVLVLGIAYKKNISDPRESPAIRIMELLRDAGAEVAYSDPHIPEFPKMRDHAFDLVSENLTAESLAAFDCVLLTTDHDAFDTEFILEHAPLIIDTRSVYHNGHANVVKA